MKYTPFSKLAILGLFSLLYSCQEAAPSQDKPIANPVTLKKISLADNNAASAVDETNNGTVRQTIAQNSVPDISTTFTEADLRYQGEEVKVTYHARCRMGCRKIEAFEIQEVIDQRKINQRKTNRNPPPGKCPSIAYEGRTERDKQKIRIIVGDCDNNPIIITVIDLENEYRCSCK